MPNTNVRKAGRCFNGAHRDSGTIVHIVPEAEPTHPWFTKALCGAVPGRKGYGWTGTERPATCDKCRTRQAIQDEIKRNIGKADAIQARQDMVFKKGGSHA